MFQKIFDKLDNSYDEIKELLKAKKLADVYTKLKLRKEKEAEYLFAIVNILLKKFKESSEILMKIDPNELSIVEKDVFYETQGLCYFEQKNYLESTRFFLKALKENPKNFYSKYNLTMIYLIKKDYENAEKGLKELLLVEPENEVLKENLRIINEEIKR